MMDTLKKNSSGLILALFFMVFILAIKDYGIHVDDIDQARYGTAVYHHLLNADDQSYLQSRQLRYSPNYEVFLAMVSGLFPGKTEIGKFLVRHITIFITFYLGVIFFTLTLRRLFQQENLVVTGLLFLLLFPPLLGFSAVTSKEIPLVAFTMIAVYFLVKYMQERKNRDLFLHIVFLAITCMVRLSGLGYLILTMYSILIVNLDPEKIKRSIAMIVLISLASVSLLFALLIGLDPLTWPDPIHILISRIRLITDFDNGGALFYNGSVIKLSEASAYMNLFYGLRKTPDLILLLGIYSFFAFAYQFFIKRKANFISRLKDSPQILVFLWFIIPLIVMLVNNSVTYSIRHLLIFAPPLVIIATLGLQYLFQSAKTSHLAVFILLAVLAANFIYLVVQNIQLHPYQVAYFNIMSGGLKNNEPVFVIEPDTLAFNEAAVWLCKNESNVIYTGPFINIYVDLYCPDNHHLTYVSNYENAEILVTYYYYSKIMPIPPGFSDMYAVKRQEVPLLTAYRKNQ